MRKNTTYIIQAKTKHITNFDPNLSKIVAEIEKLYRAPNEYRDEIPFNIKVCIDGYRYDEGVNDAVTFFVHTFFNKKDNQSILEIDRFIEKFTKHQGKPVNLIKNFIKNIFITNRKLDPNKLNFELFVEDPINSQKHSFGIISLSQNDFGWIGNWKLCQHSAIGNRGSTVEFDFNNLKTCLRNELFFESYSKMVNLIAHLWPIVQEYQISSEDINQDIDSAVEYNKQLVVR